MKRFDLQFHNVTDTEQLANVLTEIAERYRNGGHDGYHSGAYEYYLSARDESGEVIGQYRLSEVRS